MNNDRATLLEFPCRFPIKVFGIQDTQFQDVVLNLIRPHAPELTKSDISSRTSNGGKYIAVTAHITARSQHQLDAIYEALSARDDIVMSL